MKTTAHFLAAVILGVVIPHTLHAAAPEVGQASIKFGSHPAPAASASACGFSVVADVDGPQLALFAKKLLASLQQGEQVEVTVPLKGLSGTFTLSAEVTLVSGSEAAVELAIDGAEPRRAVLNQQTIRLEVTGAANLKQTAVHLRTVSQAAQASVQWDAIRLDSHDVPVVPATVDLHQCPPPVLPTLRPAIQQALIEWDWRMQDGIETERAPATYAEAIQRTFQHGDQLLTDLKTKGVPLQRDVTHWENLRHRYTELQSNPNTSPPSWEDLWREVHALRRQLVFRNPLAQVGPLLFVKQAPSIFSHQLSQYAGSHARPGGGLFVLDSPGRSMQCRQLASELPLGSYQHAEVSHDGRRVLFAYCPVEETPANREVHADHFYHLYEISADGSGLRQLTDGPYDDIAPRYLPNGQIIFVSTRRGGFHRCGRGPCPTHTLAVAEADGSNPHPISYHETHEWDPAVLGDGRIIYTRWDYVDRDAVHYQQLWSTRPDGSDVRIFYGNNTLNPVGIWEARPVPGSTRVMATAGAHHAMTAGSIILVDVTRGVDGPESITRLTPDALFPESETRVLPHGWHAPIGVPKPPPVPIEAQRWPGHCYRSPYPLSEDYFLAAYSFDPLIGEPSSNRPNMFGIYLIDRFGNKELLYRDVSISSLWPVPLRPRRRPPVVSSVVASVEQPQGTFFLQNVHAGWPSLPREAIRQLRIVQVLPKSTPHYNNPSVGFPNGSPGKQVLGTVPVEPDGSAHFTAPAGIPLAFQALDEQGRAVQIMRSVAYVQPGETVSCIGCHEHRQTAPPSGEMALALRRPPSEITPGPDGSRPLSYPLLVQPVLDKLCTECHNPSKPEGNVVLTGEPQGRYTVSYHALAPLVSYSSWGRPDNSEPLSQPGHFGARGSRLMKLLADGHENVELSAEDLDRLITWMDANALFYGTFDPTDQAKQQQGQRIEGPKLQ